MSEADLLVAKPEVGGGLGSRFGGGSELVGGRYLGFATCRNLTKLAGSGSAGSTPARARVLLGEVPVASSPRHRKVDNANLGLATAAPVEI